MLTKYGWRASDVDGSSSSPSTVYDLVANVTHESVAGTARDKENTVWKVQLRAGSGGGGNEKWFQIQDLIVEEIRKEMIFLGETVLQVCLVIRCQHPVSAWLTAALHLRFGSVAQRENSCSGGLGCRWRLHCIWTAVVWYSVRAV